MRKKLFILLGLFNFIFIWAQNPIDVVHTYGAYPGFNNIVKDIVIQPDGKSICVGIFTKYRGNTCNYIVRLNVDGSIDPSFLMGNGFNDKVNSVTLQPDGKILIGGYFSHYQSIFKPRLIRLNSDGSIDNSFTMTTSVSNPFPSDTIIQDILVLPNDKILIGGYLVDNIARLNSDGSLDTTFDPGSGFNGGVFKIGIQSDGKIIVGGSFTSFNNVTRNRIIRLNDNGSKDDTFSIGLGFSGTVNDFVIQPDSKVVICGGFATYKGIDQKKIARLLPDGSVDSTFNIGTGFPNSTGSEPQTPEKMVMDSNGNFMVVGSFTAYNGSTKLGFVKLLANGSIDSTSNFTVTDYQYAIGLGADGKAIVADRQFIYRILPDGSNDSSFNYGSGFNESSVFKTLQRPNGKYLVAGSFSHFENNFIRALVQFNTDGTKDTTFNTGTGFVYGTIYSLLLLPDGKIIAGGDFTYNQNGNFYTKLIKINTDGSIDTSFTAPFINGGVLALGLQSDGKIMVGGNFIQINNVADKYLMRLNADGTRDYSFDKGTDFDTQGSSLGVHTIVIQPDGKILIGGRFFIYRNEPHNYIMRLLPNGSVDSTFQTGDGFNSGLSKIMLQPDGKIIATGSFTSYDSQSVFGITKLNSNGSLDTSFTNSFITNQINDFVLQPDGKIITGGYTYNFNGNNLNNFVRLNPDGSNDYYFNPNAYFSSKTIYSLSLFDNGNILIGGNFETFNGVDSSKLILLRGGESPLSNTSFQQQKIQLYPNPVENSITVVLPENSTAISYTIFDITGKKVFQTNTTNSSINVQYLEKGIYILKINSESGDYVSKFIKK